MRCDKCGKEAVIQQRYSGLSLCRWHFILDFEAKAKRAIRTHNWLCRNDRIAVVLSGTVADCALLHFLRKLTGRRRDIHLFAIIYDKERQGSPVKSSSREFAGSLGIPCIAVFPEVDFTKTHNEPLPCAGDGHPWSDTQTPSLLQQVARKHRVSKLALGSSLDDEAGRVLADLLSGTPERIISRYSKTEDPVPVRPFMYASSGEIRLYSLLETGRECGDERSDARGAFAEDVKAFLEEYTLRHPSAPYSLVSLGEQLAGTGNRGWKRDAGIQPSA